MNGLVTTIQGSDYEASARLADYDPTDMSQYYTMGEYYPPQDNIDTLNIDWQGGRVEIIAYDEEDYFMQEAATRQLAEEERLSYSIEDNVFSIRFTYSDEVKINDAYKKLEIRVPAAMADKLKSVNVTNTGEVILKNITSESVTVNGADGNITCFNAYSPDMNIISENGDVDLTVDENKGYSLSFDTEKGKLDSYFESTDGKYKNGDGGYSFKIKTYSGKLTVDVLESEEQFEV